MRKIAQICALVAVLWPTAGLKADQPVFGYLEEVLVYPGAFPMLAKLDTGADHSSVNARILRQETKKGQIWLTFEVTNQSGATATFEKRVRRVARVRRPSDTATSRPVVIMEICLGTIRREVQVNLVDRTNLSFNILIGRSFLAGHAIVDSATTYTSEPRCP